MDSVGFVVWLMATLSFLQSPFRSLPTLVNRRKIVQKERELGILKDVDPHTLELWKVDVDLNIQSEDFFLNPKFKSTQKLLTWKSVLWYWLPQPADEKLHIFVKPHAQASLMPPPMADWLIELHEKLWGRKDLLDKIIRTVTLDKTDLFELEVKLQELNPSRGDDAYVPQDVLLARSAFLRSKNASSAETIADPKVDPGCGPTATLDVAASSLPADHVMDVDDLVDASESKICVAHVSGPVYRRL